MPILDTATAASKYDAHFKSGQKRPQKIITSSFLSTVKLGYNEHLWTNHYNWGSLKPFVLCCKWSFGTKYFVCYNQVSVITEFVTVYFLSKSHSVNENQAEQFFFKIIILVLSPYRKAKGNLYLNKFEERSLVRSFSDN